MKKLRPEDPNPCPRSTGWWVAGLGQHPTPDFHLFLALSLHPAVLCPLGSASLILRDIRHGGGPRQDNPSIIPLPLSSGSFLPSLHLGPSWTEKALCQGLSHLLLFILRHRPRSCSRSLPVTCKFGHMPWEVKEEYRAALPSAEPLVATHRVFTYSTASIPPRRKSMCGTHHGSTTSPVSLAPSCSTLPSFAHASHTGFPSGPETHLLFPLPETLVPRFFHGLHLPRKSPS